MSRFANKYPSIFGIIAFLLLYITIKINTDTILLEALKRIICSALIIIILYPVFRFNYIKIPFSGLKRGFQIAKGQIIMSVIGSISCILSVLLSLIVTPETLAAANLSPVNTDGLLLRFIFYTLYAFSIGLVEELAFRQGLFSCFNLQIKNFKNRTLIIALVTSIFFGFAHVMSSLSSDPIAIVTAILKTLQTGMMGFMMCAIALETGSLWPSIIIHAIGDYLLMFTEIFQTVESNNYVASSSNSNQGIATIIFYIVTLIAYIPGIKKSIAILKYTDNV